MRVNEDRAILARVLGPFAVAFVFLSVIAAPAVFAQENDDDPLADLTDESPVEEVVVTGSRLKRDTYSSISPLQVISGQVSREIGSIDPSTILQDSTAAAGTQIDITFQGFVLDNGPGSSTIDLRGLGAERTLVLINGRRAAPVGVEGAPFAVDLNIIPSSLVDRYEILTDGASSVYGSDAIAGVSNIILRKDFDGFEFEAYSTVPEYSGGVTNTLSAAWGKNGDRGSFGVAVDYTKGDAVERNDRPWSAGCESYYEQTTDGSIRTELIGYNFDFGMKKSPCTVAFGARRVFDQNPQLFGSIYYTPGETNTGIPNFSEAADFVVSDLNDDGIPDVDFTDYFITNETGGSHLFPEQERISAMAIGEYTFEGEMNLTPYVEVLYNKRETYAFSPGASLFETAPGDNPYNPCNSLGLGVDCGLAFDGYTSNPGYTDDFQALFGDFCLSIGLTIDQCVYNTFFAPIGSVPQAPLQAQVSVEGDRSDVRSEVDQLRIVAGIRGDLPQLSFGPVDNWSFDVAVSSSDGTGTALRRGINGDRLTYSLETSRFSVPGDISSPIVCGNNDGCVPVNLFAPSLYESLIGNDFATQEERDYLFSNRTFDTTYKQKSISAIITGDIFDLPAGSVGAAIGYEYRNDEIDSIPNDVARDGLLFGFFRDLGAVGEKDTEEWFVEVEAPLLANEPAFHELTLNLSTRHTDDEFYGGAYTYSGKLAWRPVESLLLKGTVGTSYRAPNLRENFLQGTTGFLTLDDPCVTPESALTISPGGGSVYDPSGDPRSQIVIDNCFANGVDPRDLGINAAGNTTPRYSMEIFGGVGGVGIREEKSESFTAGFAWEQPFFSDFDLTIGATYYEVELRDEIIELSSEFSIFECYNDPEGDSPYCANIHRVPSNGLIDHVDEAFINRDSLKTRGVDLSFAFDWPTEIFGRAVDFSSDITLNRKLEFSDVFVPLDGSAPSVDSDLGEFGLPEWEGQGVFRADINDYRLTWSTRYLGSVSADPDLLAANDFSNWLDAENGKTCLGPTEGDVDCRPVGWADNYFRHDVSVFYYGDVWTFGVGSRNVLNEEPPKVDGRVVFSGWNVPFGSGYDVNGRSYFVNVAARFE